MYTFFINNTTISFQRKSTPIKDSTDIVYQINTIVDITNKLNDLSKQIEFQHYYRCEQLEQTLNLTDYRFLR